MESYPWPGNVRELENTIQRASVLATTDVLLPKDIPLGMVGTTPALALDGASPSGLGTAAGNVFVDSDAASNPLEGEEDSTEGKIQSAINLLFHAANQDANIQLLPWLEREFTIAAMKLTRGNQLKAAKLLGVTRATLRKRIERFGITRELNIQ